MKLARSLPGGGHTALVADLAEEGAALALLEQAGDIDVLVANAALPASGSLEGFSQDEIGRALRVNLESPVRMTRELLPHWLQRGSGHFVFISSISGFASTPRASLYAATKFGLRGFALNLREDLRGSGVGVSVITPGLIREAGMFAESGAAPPPGIGTGTPQQVGYCRGASHRARQVGDLRGSASSAGARSLRDDGAGDFRSTCRLCRYKGGGRDRVGPDRQALARPGYVRPRGDPMSTLSRPSGSSPSVSAWRRVSAARFTRRGRLMRLTVVSPRHCPSLAQERLWPSFWQSRRRRLRCRHVAAQPTRRGDPRSASLREYARHSHINDR